MNYPTVNKAFKRARGRFAKSLGVGPRSTSVLESVCRLVPKAALRTRSCVAVRRYVAQIQANLWYCWSSGRLYPQIQN
eukprot:1833285-Amphidinium_carterae.1